MTNVLALPALLLLLAVGMAANLGGDATVRATLAAPFTLKLRQRAEIAGEHLRIEFRAVVEDSRCPEGARCIREGEGVILIVVTTRSGASEERRLQIPPDDASQVVVDGYRLGLRALEPHPRVGESPRAADYRATLLVTR